MAVEVSVIVPTFNRRKLLTRLIKSLFNQTMPEDRYEVVLVSDGSTDGTVEAVRAFQQQHRNLRLVEQRNRGPAAARNAGVRASRGQYLAFTDDDCVVSQNWIEAIMAAFERTGALAVQGRTSTDRSACTPLTHQVHNPKGMYSAPTCNVAYRKSVFDSIGGFDESFPFPHDEDTDFAWRAEKLGQIVFAPEAHVLHPPRIQTLAVRASWVRFLQSEFLLYAKHPEVYQARCSATPWLTIYGRIFVVNQLAELKSSFGYLVRHFRPRQFAIGVAVVMVRWCYLVRFFPDYLRASRRARAMGVSSE